MNAPILIMMIAVPLVATAMAVASVAASRRDAVRLGSDQGRASPPADGTTRAEG